MNPAPDRIGIGSRVNSSRMIRAWALGMAILGALLLWSSMAFAADGALIIDAKTNGLVLTDLRSAKVADKAEISARGPLENDSTILKAQGRGPLYYWSFLSLQNNESVPVDYVMAFEPQRFPGSGILPVVKSGPQVLGGVFTRDGSKFKLQSIGDTQTLNFTLPAKDTMNFAIESLGPHVSFSLWRPESFQSTQVSSAFYKGLIEGLILLLLAGFVVHFAWRAGGISLAGLFFAFAMALVIESNIGFLATLSGADSRLGHMFQASVESVLVAATALCLGRFVLARGDVIRLGLFQIGVPVLALINVAYALAEPAIAGGLARSAMVLVTIAGLVQSFQPDAKNATPRVVSRVFWIGLVLWVFLAGLLAVLASPKPYWNLLFAASGALVMITLAYAVLRMAAAQGLAARPFITDATLRSLALSSGRHVMWDWQPATQNLEVGKEFFRLLDLPDGPAASRNKSAFYQAIHPLDLPAYQKIAERQDFEAGERISLELRLKLGDGSYRWFDLQARAVAGPDGNVDRCIGTLTDIGRLKEVEERLATNSLQDTLTGVATKGLLLDRLERGLHNPRGLAQRVLVIDIDRFKLINEGLGHDAGDRILTEVSRRLQELTSQGETLARLAGGQFALLAPESKARAGFEAFSEEIGRAVSLPISHQGQEIVVTASIGLSPPGKGEIKAQDLMDQAQVAMLEARADGGGKAVFYHAEMRDDRARLLSLESDLRRALTQNEITIHYQPIVYLGTLEVTGFEALARWQHPELGLLEPAEFLEVAETAGMMGEIGLYMLQGAARQLGIWQRRFNMGSSFFVAVNVSAMQLNDSLFPEHVSHVLRREGVHPGSLKLEITETVLMRQPERSAALLRQLKALGVGLACDDFGTGYSSLSSLRDFPFDTLKMDRSFINLEQLDERHAQIITSITTLAQGLNMVVVAEGIETQEQIDRLAQLGVGYGQGYFVGRPEAAEAATEKLSGLPVVPVLPSPMPKPEIFAQPEPPAITAPVLTRPSSLYAPVLPLRSPSLAQASLLAAPSETDFLPSLFALTPAPREQAVAKSRKKSPVKAKKKVRRGR